MKNRLDVAVSYYEHIYTKFPVRATLIDLLTTNRYKSRVLAVRTELELNMKLYLLKVSLRELSENSISSTECFLKFKL